MASHNDGVIIPMARPGMSAASVPARYSLSQYVRYERFIKDLMVNWPRATEWFPESVSIDTFARGLRNSIKSVLAFHWSVADIDIPRLASIWPAAQIYTYPTRVVFASRDAPRIVSGETGVVEQKHSFTVDATDTEAVKAATVLLDRKHLTNPVILKGDPNEAFIYIEEAGLDVTIAPAPDLGSDIFLML